MELLTNLAIVVGAFLASAGFFGGLIWAATAGTRCRARADRILVTLQAMEQMGAYDDPAYDALSAEYAALNRRFDPPRSSAPWSAPFAD